MIRRFHGIDRHKNFSTISVLNLEGKEIDFSSICLNLKSYIDGLGASPNNGLLMHHFLSNSGCPVTAIAVLPKVSSKLAQPHFFIKIRRENLTPCG